MSIPHVLWDNYTAQAFITCPLVFSKNEFRLGVLLDTKFDVLKMNAHLKNAFGCIPFLAMEAKSKNQNDIWIADHPLVLALFFCQTVSSISTKGAWTPNLMFWKWTHILKMLLAASPFFPWRLKVEIKWIYELLTMI